MVLPMVQAKVVVERILVNVTEIRSPVMTMLQGQLVPKQQKQLEQAKQQRGGQQRRQAAQPRPGQYQHLATSDPSILPRQVRVYLQFH